MKLTQQGQAILRDMSAFIAWSIIKDKDLTWVLTNVGHDVMGILNNEPCFLPRTTGYFEILEKHHQEGG